MFKHFLFLVLLTFSTQILFAQGNLTFRSNTKPTIKGKLIGYNPEVDADLIVWATVTSPALEDIKREAEIQADGTFQIDLEYPLLNRQAWFYVDKLYFGQLFLTKDLMITIDLDGLKNSEKQNFGNPHVQYSGTDGDRVNFANQFSAYLKSQKVDHLRAISKTMRNYDLSAEEKVKQYRQHHQNIINLIDEFTADNPSKYADFLKNERTSRTYSIMASAYWGKEIPASLFNEIIAHEPYFLSSQGIGYYAQVARLIKYPTPERRLDMYKKYLLPSINDATEKQRLSQFIQLDEARLEGRDYDEERYKQESRHLFKNFRDQIGKIEAQLFYETLTQLNLDEEKEALLLANAADRDILRQKPYFEVILPKMKSTWVLDYINLEKDKTKAAMAQMEKELAQSKSGKEKSQLGNIIGTLNNGAELYHAAHEQLSDLFQAIRNEHPGKAIIIDLWAVWCGPCIIDMQRKESDLNKKKLREMGVEVIYLCSSDRGTIETWKKQISKMEMGPAQHIFLSDALSKAIMTNYNLLGYPSHIFLNKDGKYKPDVVNRISKIDFNKVKKNIR